MKTILVVDDEVDNTEVLRLLLETEGYVVDSAPNGRECLERMREARPDVLVLDLMMPVMSGWEVLDVLAHDDRLREVPVIVASAGDPKSVACEYRHAWLQKPIDIERLLGLVRQLAG